jgi:hypothetical protein
VARKGGETVERLAQRRLEYLDLQGVMPAYQVVDADRPLGEVVDDVVGRIVAFVGGPTRAEASGQPNEPEPAPVPAPAVELAAAMAQPPIVDSPSAVRT